MFVVRGYILPCMRHLCSRFYYQVTNGISWCVPDFSPYLIHSKAHFFPFPLPRVSKLGFRAEYREYGVRVFALAFEVFQCGGYDERHE